MPVLLEFLLDKDGRMASAFIDDGYTASKTFDGEYAGEKFHDAVRVTFRPLTSRGVHQLAGRLSRAVGDGSDEKKIAAGADLGDKAIASQLVEWDLTDRGGHAIPITAENVGKLESHLRGSLLTLIMGGISPDEPVSEDDAKN